MINLAKVSYKVVALTSAGEKLDITGVVSELGWEEGEKELAMRISMKVANARYNQKLLSEYINPLTPIFVYAIIDGASQEVARGNIEEWSPTENSDGTQYISITAYDNALALRHNKENRYWSDGSSTGSRIQEVCSAWGIPLDYQGPNVAHDKSTIKNKYLSDIIIELLDDAKKKGAGTYFLRSKEGKIQVIPRGTNTDIFHFHVNSSLLQATDSFDASGVVTKVVIVGKADSEGHQSQEAVVQKNVDKFGVRQEIIERGDKDKSLDEATKSANEILKEKSSLKRKTTIQTPDIPFLRKGDRIYVDSNIFEGYFFVKSVRHNAADMKMNMEIDEDKEMNKANGINTDSNESSEFA